MEALPDRGFQEHYTSNQSCLEGIAATKTYAA